MRYVKSTNRDLHALLISGMPNSGKSHSLPTFIYGPYDYFTEHDEAMEYAKAQGDPKMVVLSCPGEKGHRTLFQTEHITVYRPEYDNDEDLNDVKWSIEAMRAFNIISAQVVKEGHHFIVTDGLHSCWKQQMNIITQGRYLRGEDLNTGSGNKYQAAAWYSQSHTAFGQLLNFFYTAPVPLFIATTWEEYQAGTNELQAGKQMAISDQRYLWPAIPGSMALSIVGQFDARLSARLEKICLTAECEDKKDYQEHHVWQFYPGGEVKGCGIKGLRMSKDLKKTPFIHQNYDDLKALIEAFS